MATDFLLLIEKSNFVKATRTGGKWVERVRVKIKSREHVKKNMDFVLQHNIKLSNFIFNITYL